MADSPPQYDLVIVGAGISGLAAAYYMKTYQPHKTFIILESREHIGGTWDFFKVCPSMYIYTDIP